MTITLIPAEQCVEDAQRLMEWRNDPLTLAMSFNQKPKTWPAFWDEYREQYWTSGALQPVFAYYEGRPVGFLRFRALDIAELPCPNCDISIQIAPKERDQGLAVPLLCEASRWLRERGIQAILAEVKPENAVSSHIFTRAGYSSWGSFIKEGPDTEVLRYVMALGSSLGQSDRSHQACRVPQPDRDGP
ncbi:MAG: GNAT family N-acetyltransferase [Chlamydiia bacterium]|nr:GNAT family N-acetyltransferase [Chlamydiia bacterium]